MLFMLALNIESLNYSFFFIYFIIFLSLFASSSDMVTFPFEK